MNIWLKCTFAMKGALQFMFERKLIFFSKQIGCECEMVKSNRGIIMIQ